MHDGAAWIARHRMHTLGLWGPGRSTPGAVVAHLTAMQAQEHAYARWSVAQRASSAPDASALDAAFDEGRLLRTHVLRPTWHFVAPEDLRWLMVLSGPLVSARSARRYLDLALDPATLTRAADVIAESVAAGPRTRKELGEALERRGISAEGQRLPHLLMHAELHAVVCSGPMRGKQHTYAAFDERVPPGCRLHGEEALAELARRYFATRGPATTTDFSWWAGLRVAEAKRGLALVSSELSSRVVDERTYWFADLDVTDDETSPRVDLVQCYDEAIISYRQSRDVLHTPSVVFRAPGTIDGFAHVLLLDGQLLGHWRVVRARGTIRVETRPVIRLERAEETALAAAVDRYQRFAAPALP